MNKDNERIKFDVLPPVNIMKVMEREINIIVNSSVMNLDL